MRQNKKSPFLFGNGLLPSSFNYTTLTLRLNLRFLFMSLRPLLVLILTKKPLLRAFFTLLIR